MNRDWIFKVTPITFLLRLEIALPFALAPLHAAFLAAIPIVILNTWAECHVYQASRPSRRVFSLVSWSVGNALIIAVLFIATGLEQGLRIGDNAVTVLWLATKLAVVFWASLSAVRIGALVLERFSSSLLERLGGTWNHKVCPGPPNLQNPNGGDLNPEK